jgi:hypothetical protein
MHKVMAVFWRMVFEGAIRQARKGREVLINLLC